MFAQFKFNIIFAQHMSSGIEFFTATCLNWNDLLKNNIHKEIIISSLKFLHDDKRVFVYGFVIMDNHIHLLWRKQDLWLNKNVQQMFLKYTAQMMKFNLLENNPSELIKYKSTQADRNYHFWERDPRSTTMCNRKVLEQKLDYIHQNPVRKNMCSFSEDYKYSTARYYKLDEETQWPFITHYTEHI